MLQPSSSDEESDDEVIAVAAPVTLSAAPLRPRQVSSADIVKSRHGQLLEKSRLVVSINQSKHICIVSYVANESE